MALGDSFAIRDGFAMRRPTSFIAAGHLVAIGAAHRKARITG
jgi:hypothetical protein